MSNYIDFYFDIISPYSYIAYKKIQKINKISKIKFNYKPILLGGLHNLAEITAPAFNKYKIKFLKNDCELVAKKNNIDFKWNVKFPVNSLKLMRGYLFIQEDLRDNYLKIFFNAYWKDNLDLSDDKNIKELLNILNIDDGKFFNGIKDQLIKDDLKNLTNKAFEKEIFGAPTFVINDKIFWGQDRLEYALDELKNN